MITPAGTFSYSYDAGGRMTSLTNPGSESFAWTYLDNDWLWGQQSVGSFTATHTYNAKGLLTNLATRKNDMANTLLSEFSAQVYNGVGSRTSVTANVPGVPAYSGLTTYAYDSKQQLTQEQSARAGGYTNGFAHDAAGNITSFKGVLKTYNADNQDNAYTFDGNGNPTTYKGVACSFDPENRLTAYGAILTAGYRADGLRAWKQVAAGRTYFLYDGITPVCELNASGNVIATNTFGINGLLSRNTSAGSVFYSFDAQGNVTQRHNAAATVLSSHMFDGFGTEASTVAVTDPFSYKGQWGYFTDRETGLQSLAFRYYDSSTGRFLNRDPISYAGGINLYGYVGNDPLSYLDPLGTNRFKDAWNKLCLVFWMFCKRGPRDPDEPRPRRGRPISPLPPVEFGLPPGTEIPPFEPVRPDPTDPTDKVCKNPTDPEPFPKKEERPIPRYRRNWLPSLPPIDWRPVIIGVGAIGIGAGIGFIIGGPGGALAGGRLGGLIGRRFAIGF